MTALRPRARIGGASFALAPEVRARMLSSLGERATLLADQPGATVHDDYDDGAFVDARREADGTLVLSRDAIGHRTLYYCELPAEGGRRRVVFASRLPPLVAAGAPRTLDHAAVTAYLAYAYIPGQRTLLREVHELVPGETIRFPADPAREVARSQHWSLPGDGDHDAAAAVGPDDDGLCTALRRELEAAIDRALPGDDQPIGATLSGGIDSSLVVALARRRHAGPLHTYSIHFGAEHKSELEWSSLVAAHCRTEHHVCEITADAVRREFDATMGLLDKPIGDPLTIPNAIVFREASSQVGMVLNGEGGDPCFGGPKNIPMILSELYGDNDGDGDPYAREHSFLRSHQHAYDDLGHMLHDDLRGVVREQALERELRPHLVDPRWHALVQRLMAVNVSWKGGHHILPKIDALSAPAGVQPRSPLFDRRVVELAFTIPARLKLHGAVEKWLLKRAVADTLPAAIIDRPKSGMLVPVEAWFRGPLLALARERVLDGLRPWRLFDQRWLEQLVAGKNLGLRPRRGRKLWLLATLESWLRSMTAW